MKKFVCITISDSRSKDPNISDLAGLRIIESLEKKYEFLEKKIIPDEKNIISKTISDFLNYKDFQSLLDAAEIEVSDSSAVFTKDNQMKLVQFLQSISNPEKTSGEIECGKDEMLFCQSERRISDGRNGRNGKADNVICQCGPMFTRF